VLSWSGGGRVRVPPEEEVVRTSAHRWRHQLINSLLAFVYHHLLPYISHVRTVMCSNKHSLHTAQLNGSFLLTKTNFISSL
jgi:hypothetical protein